MAVTVQCPRLNCRAILRVPDDVRGKRVRCSECGMALLVPKAGKPGRMVYRPTREKKEEAEP